MSTHLLLVAGGIGNRMGSSVPKQFIELDGKPIFCHTLDRFINSVPEISVTIAIHPEWKEVMSNTLNIFYPKHEFILIEGGETRYHSVKNGLEHLNSDGNDIVLIHDAARPFVSKETIERCLAGVEKNGNAVPVLALKESIRILLEKKSVATERKNFVSVQTPQCFRLREIKNAFLQNYQEKFTDDASVFEEAGHMIHLVEGNEENIKITTPADLPYAEFLLKRK